MDAAKCDFVTTHRTVVFEHVAKISVMPQLVKSACNHVECDVLQCPQWQKVTEVGHKL